MDNNGLIILLSGFAIVLGFFGVILPMIPGIWLSLLGLFIFKYTTIATLSWTTIILILVLTIISQILSYIIPIATTKHFGGSKYGVWGAIIGLFVGMIFGGPFGIILGPFIGAFVGELVKDRKNTKNALKAALGSFTGFLLVTGIELILCSWMLFLFLFDVYNWLSHSVDWKLF